MNYIKGFRFHPTDEEAIEHLWDKQVFDRDLSVQVGDSVISVITQLKHICEFDPWELPELSELETGNKDWYFFSIPKYKYRNSARKNRVTKNGYWKPTGKPRQIVTIYQGERINGSKQTLVFYKGRVSDKQKKENKTHWVMYELELKPPNQRSITLCKLKNKYKKVVTASDEETQSSHSLSSSLESPDANDAIPKDPLNSKDLMIESQAINECSEIQTQITTNEEDGDEFVNSLLTKFDLPENQEDLNQATTLAMTPQNDVVKDVIPMTQITTNEEDGDEFFNSLLTTFDPENQEDFNQATTLAMTPQNHVVKDVIPMEHLESNYALQYGLSMAELTTVLEAPKIPDGVEHHDAFSTNEQDDEFRNFSLTLDEVEEILNS